ncbi:MAG: plastocyanin/azurin family copper-binding protein [Balneolaceae bacterium]|nr:plastocyanin/azurin family copper-binding protein [Balneolaceae bacterium]
MNKLLFKSVFVVLLLAFTACGGGGDSAQETAESQETESMDAMDDDVRTIDIIGVDDMKFVVAEEGEGLVTGAQAGENYILEAIEASPGEEIRISLTTTSNLPPTAMSHNFVLLAMGTDIDAFVRAALTARDSEYIPADFEDQIIAYTDMLGDGESDSVTFTAPEEPGEYTFICSFPGHYAGGMVGTLIVQ